MHNSRPLAALLATGLLGVLTLWAGSAEDPAKDPPKPDAPKGDLPPLVVIDGAGKEQKLKSYKIIQGTRRLAWLAPQTGEPEPKPKEPVKEPVPPKGPRPKAPPAPPSTGPETLEFREENSTTFKIGVLTLIPLDQLAALDFDSEKKLATAKVAGDKEEIALTGTTRYDKINKIVIETEVDKGDLGVAEVRFLGGVAKGGIRSLHFPTAKKAAAPTGRPATVSIMDKGMKTEMPVTDLQVLYRVETGGEKLSPLLFFKKTLKIDVAKIKKIVPAESDGQDLVWQVTLKDGSEETLTLLTSVTLDGKAAELEGLLGKVPAGYKLFPTHTVSEAEFDQAKEPAKDKEKDKDKDKEKDKDK